MKSTTKTRICSVCRKRKLLTSYHKNRAKPLKRQYECKKCGNLRYLKLATDGRHQRYYASLSKEQRAVRLARNKKKNPRYYVRNAKKNRARTDVARAIRAGTLVRPRRCEQCKSLNPQAHHHKGYARKNALDVLWLCQPCHFKAHRSYYKLAAQNSSL